MAISARVINMPPKMYFPALTHRSSYLRRSSAYPSPSSSHVIPNSSTQGHCSLINCSNASLVSFPSPISSYALLPFRTFFRKLQGPTRSLGTPLSQATTKRPRVRGQGKLAPRDAGVVATRYRTAGPGTSITAYFFLWRMRRRIFLYLCLRIFFRRFLTTLPTSILLLFLFGPLSKACRISLTAATIDRSFPWASSTVRVFRPQSGSTHRASFGITCSAFPIRSLISAGLSILWEWTSRTPKERSLLNGCFLKRPIRSNLLLDISRSKLWTGNRNILG